MSPNITSGRIRRAFSQLEVPQALLVLGVLTAMVGVPQLMQWSERGKSGEAFKYLRGVQQAQRAHHRAHGSFATEVRQLDLPRLAPAYFSVGSMSTTDHDLSSMTTLDSLSLADAVEPGIATDKKVTQEAGGWRLTLTRRGGLAPGYGDYRVTFTERGFDPSASTIPAAVRPASSWHH